MIDRFCRNVTVAMNSDIMCTFYFRSYGFPSQWVTIGDGTQCETSVSGAGGGLKRLGMPVGKFKLSTQRRTSWAWSPYKTKNERYHLKRNGLDHPALFRKGFRASRELKMSLRP